MPLADHTESLADRTWRGPPHPSSRVSSMHMIIGVLYLLTTGMLTIGLLTKIRNGTLSEGLVIFWMFLLAFSLGHIWLSRVSARRVPWSRGVSVAMVLPLLLAFPIGTIAAGWVIYHAMKDWD